VPLRQASTELVRRKDLEATRIRVERERRA
jgi:hypothetical protein